MISDFRPTLRGSCGRVRSIPTLILVLGLVWSLAACTARDESPGKPTLKEGATVKAEHTESAILGAGCFWCIEAVLLRIPGVASVQSGYTGGQLEDPTYDDIKTGASGHIEVVRVIFDPEQLTFDSLLRWFEKAHDPTSWDRQGGDAGPQYRSAIFATSDEQSRVAREWKKAASERLGKEVVTEIRDAVTFYPAEAYHQNFFALNPRHGYCQAVIDPKLKKLDLDTESTKD